MPSRPRLAAPIAAVLLAAAPATAAAVEPVFDWTVSAAAFPLGAETTFSPGVRQPLWDKPGNPLLEDTYVQTNATVMFTPAFTRAGVDVAFQPATIFELRVRYSVVGYYGAFTAVYLYDDPDTVYDGDTRREMDRTSGIGSRLSVQPTLRAKGGPIVFQGWSIFRYHTLSPGQTTDVGDYWVEPELNLMIGRPGTSWDHNGLLAAELDLDSAIVYLGGVVTYRHTDDSDDSIFRLGPAVVWMPEGGNWTVLGIAQFYAQDRLYTQAAPPYIAARLQYSL